MKKLIVLVLMITVITYLNSCSKNDIVNNTNLYIIDVDSTKLICSCISDTTIPPSIDIDNEKYVMINSNTFTNDGDSLFFDTNLSLIFSNQTGTLSYTGSNFTGPQPPRQIDYIVNGNTNTGKIYLYFYNFNGSNPKKVWGTYSKN